MNKEREKLTRIRIPSSSWSRVPPVYPSATFLAARWCLWIFHWTQAFKTLFTVRGARRTVHNRSPSYPSHRNFSFTATKSDRKISYFSPLLFPFSSIKSLVKNLAVSSEKSSPIRALESSNEIVEREDSTHHDDTHDNIIHERAKERRDWRLGGVEELCSITVDQVFVKSGRLVGHRRRAKPSGSLVRAAGWWSRGSRRVWWRGGGGWRVEGRWLEAAAVSRRWKSTGIRFPLSFTILDRSDQTGSGKILFSSSGGEKTLVSWRIVAPERNPLSFSDPGMILTGWGGEWNRPRPRIDPRRGRLSLSLSLHGKGDVPVLSVYPLGRISQPGCCCCCIAGSSRA